MLILFWTSPTHPCDANGDGIVAPMDALNIINHLNAVGSHELVVPPSPTDMPPPFLDVNEDGVVTPLDALVVINYLNGHGSARAAAWSSGLMVKVRAGLWQQSIPATGRYFRGHWGNLYVPQSLVPAAGADANTSIVPAYVADKSVAMCAGLPASHAPRLQLGQSDCGSLYDHLEVVLDDIAGEVATALVARGCGFLNRTSQPSSAESTVNRSV